MNGMYLQCLCGSMIPAMIMEGPYGFYLGAQCWSCKQYIRESGDFTDRTILEDMLKWQLVMYRSLVKIVAEH